MDTVSAKAARVVLSALDHRRCESRLGMCHRRSRRIILPMAERLNAETKLRRRLERRA